MLTCSHPAHCCWNDAFTRRALVDLATHSVLFDTNSETESENAIGDQTLSCHGDSPSKWLMEARIHEKMLDYQEFGAVYKNLIWKVRAQLKRLRNLLEIEVQNGRRIKQQLSQKMPYECQEDERLINVKTESIVPNRSDAQITRNNEDRSDQRDEKVSAAHYYSHSSVDTGSANNSVMKEHTDSADLGMQRQFLSTEASVDNMPNNEQELDRLNFESEQHMNLFRHLERLLENELRSLCNEQLLALERRLITRTSILTANKIIDWIQQPANEFSTQTNSSSFELTSKNFSSRQTRFRLFVDAGQDLLPVKDHSELGSDALVPKLLLTHDVDEELVFYLKQIADCFRYIAETCHMESNRSVVSLQAQNAYTAAWQASEHMSYAQRIKLSVIINMSAFLHDVMSSPDRAAQLCKNAFDHALTELQASNGDAETNEQWRDTIVLMQLLKQNLSRWSSST